VIMAAVNIAESGAGVQARTAAGWDEAGTLAVGRIHCTS
jgi:hypothetical protein